jgi:hypothetical protein
MLDTMFEPLYTPEFSDAEREMLASLPYLRPTETTFGKLRQFGTATVNILYTRLHSEAYDHPVHYAAMRALMTKRRDLFFHREDTEMYKEALETGIVVPLALASYVYRRESNESSFSGPISNDIIDISSLLEIMTSDSCDKMLLHLTKGPNGFLGEASLGSLKSDDFFAFQKEQHEESRALSYSDAFKVEDGRVVGLSDKYFLAAQKKRQSLFRNTNARLDRHRGTDSSGCPVRHGFEDETGEHREPLVIVAKNFVVAAMKVASESSMI